MKKIVAIIISLFLPCMSRGEVSMTVAPDHHNGIYQTGETVQWTVRIRGAGQNPSGTAQYILKHNGLHVVKKGNCRVENGTGTFTGTVKVSGTLIAEVMFQGTGAAAQWRGGCVFNPEKLKPTMPPPQDFDAFWNRKVRELNAIPLDVRLKRIPCDESGIELYTVTMNNILSKKIHGYIALPKNNTKKLPAWITFPHAGVITPLKSWATEPAKNGWLAMTISAYDVELEQDAKYYDDWHNKTRGDKTVGRDDPERFWMLPVFLSTYRAVDYLSKRNDWDQKVLLVDGASQGGAMAIAAAGLHPKVTGVAALFPACCDNTAVTFGARASWPNFLKQQSQENEKKLFETSRYYDMANFARRIDCPTLVGIGLIDNTCPAENIFAMYNSLKGKNKRYVSMPLQAHGGEGGEGEGIFIAEKEKFAKSLAGGCR
jgi:cephalosporin-C deacetylase